MATFDISLVKTFGQIAGIGGLSLFVFVYLFREVIRKNIFPRFTREHAYQIMRLFMILVFLLSLSGISAWVYTSKRNNNSDPEIGTYPTEDPAPKIAEWLKWIDDRSYDLAWESMPKQFQSHLSKKSFEEVFNNQRAPLGEVLKREFSGSNDYISPEGYPPGHYQVRNYLTTFKNGHRAIEYVTVYGTKDGWKVVLHSMAPAPASNI